MKVNYYTPGEKGVKALFFNQGKPKPLFFVAVGFVLITLLRAFAPGGNASADASGIKAEDKVTIASASGGQDSLSILLSSTAYTQEKKEVKQEEEKVNQAASSWQAPPSVRSKARGFSYSYTGKARARGRRRTLARRDVAKDPTAPENFFSKSTSDAIIYASGKKKTTPSMGIGKMMRAVLSGEITLVAGAPSPPVMATVLEGELAGASLVGKALPTPDKRVLIKFDTMILEAQSYKIEAYAFDSQRRPGLPAKVKGPSKLLKALKYALGVGMTAAGTYATWTSYPGYGFMWGWGGGASGGQIAKMAAGQTLMREGQKLTWNTSGKEKLVFKVSVQNFFVLRVK